MTPAARLQAAIEILGALENTNQAADRFLRDWFRARRYAGAKDRAAIGERVFAVLRHRASLGWRLHSDQPRALVLASLMKDGLDESAIDDLFNGGGYGPAPLDAAERAAIAWDPREPPAWVQGDFPEFLEAELTRSLGDNWRDEMCVLNGRATIDLRVNTLKGARDAVLRELGDQGFAVEPTPYALYGIRLVEREKGSQLHSTRAFLDGRFEFQDEAAQIAAMLCAAKPGERILDLAAGAGGKALALAAAMHNDGAILARDHDAARLAQLAPRALRAGVTIIRQEPISLSPGTGGEGGEPCSGERERGRTFDAVFVDAPCSGSGAWRRQPEQKWRLTPGRLQQMQNVQDTLLDEAAAAARGRIVYATCSILMGENEDRIEAFLSRHPQFRIVPAESIWHERTGTFPPPGMGKFFKATPRTTGTDGFFTAVLTRTP